MSGRKLLPAYAKRLLDERRAGRHPSEINLVYGENWWAGTPPKICINPDEFQPGKYDFTVVAGTRVLVIDQGLEIADVDSTVLPWKFGKFYDLLSELATADAYVCVWSPLHKDMPARELWLIGRESRYFNAVGKPRCWPRWWNADLQAKQERRCELWLTHQAYELGIFRRERGATA